jgi:hypothetical protein
VRRDALCGLFDFGAFEHAKRAISHL